VDHKSQFLLGYYNPGTRATYRQAITALATATGADPLTLSGEQIAEWIESQLKTLSPATVKLRWAALSQFYAWALTQGLIEQSPLATLKRPTGSRRGTGRALTQDDAALLWTAARENSKKATRDVALLEVALRCGLRRAELAALRWEWIKSDYDPPFLGVIGKGNKERRVTLHSATLAALAEWRAIGGNGSGLVFGLSPMGIYSMIKRRAADAGIELTPHDLRRTFVTRALDAGVPVEKVQAAAGHSKIETTMRYDRARRDLVGADFIEWNL